LARNPDGSDATGFPGLDSMLSNVEETIAAVPEAKAPEPKKSEAHFVAQDRTEGAKSSAPAPSGGFTTAGKWFLGVVVVGILLAVFGSGGKPKNTPIIYSSPPAPAPAPAPAPSKWEDIPPKPAPAPSVPEAPSAPPTEVPPVGTDLVLSAAQMRYCFTEDIRGSAVQPEVNRYSSKEIAEFNAMVSDYNSRCGNFRYRKGTLEGIRAEVESRRASIEVEAKKQWAREHHSAKSSSEKPKAAQKKRDFVPIQPESEKAQQPSMVQEPYKAPEPYKPPEPSKLPPPRKSGIPEHAHINQYTNSVECDTGFRRNGNSCDRIDVPANGHINPYSNSMECDTGYRRNGNSCDRIAVPMNGHINPYSNSMECDTGYRRNGNSCVPL